MDWRLGTMGFGYSEWAGVFYPRGVKPGDYLAYYATRFDTVELDTTFHAMPDAARVRRWVDVTPPGFRFCVKTPRLITHDTPIERAAEDMRRFLEIVREFGPKLGVVLLQFPPSFTVGAIGKFAGFINTLPADVRFAVEFRHDSWQTDRTEDVLRGRGLCLVAADYHSPPHPVMTSADFLYVRWIGIHRQFRDINLELVDVGERLVWWKERLDRREDRVRTVWGFFNNDYAGYAVATCERFKRLVGVPVADEPGDAGTLFE